MYTPRVCVQQPSLGGYQNQGYLSAGAAYNYNGYPGVFSQQRRSSMYGRPEFAQAQPAFEASQILPSLYLGSYDDAMNIEGLKRIGITHVLNVANDCPVPHGQYQAAGIRPLHLQIEDCDDVTIAPYTAQGVPFMQQAISTGGKVFVHCRYGVSRSAMMVIAYLMQFGSDGARGMGYNEATSFCRARRPRIDPNPGFVAQLQMLDSARQQPFFGSANNRLVSSAVSRGRYGGGNTLSASTYGSSYGAGLQRYPSYNAGFAY